MLRMAQDAVPCAGKNHAEMPARWETDLIGLLAGFCTTLSLVPQLHRLWRSKCALDLSLTMFFIFVLGVVLWLLYGISIRFAGSWSPPTA